MLFVFILDFIYLFYYY